MTPLTVQRVGLGLAVLLAGVGLGFGISAHFRPPDVVVTHVTTSEAVAPSSAKSAGVAPAPASSIPATGSTGIACTTPQPAGNWVCQNGAWVNGVAAADTPAVGGNPGGCVTGQPGPGWTCRGGVWTAPNVELDSASGALIVTPVVTPITPGMPGAASIIVAAGCLGPPPAVGYTCQNSVWTPAGPGFPSQSTPTAPGAPVNNTPAPCAGAAPGPGYSCMNGVWQPAAPGAPSPTMPPPTPTVPVGPVPCAGAAPGPEYACVNGSWVIRDR